MENYRKGFPFSVFLSGAYRLHLILWYKFYHLHNIPLGAPYEYLS